MTTFTPRTNGLRSALIYSQKYLNADVAGKADMLSKLQTALGKQSRTILSKELRAAGIESVLSDDSDVPDQLAKLYDLLNRG